MPMLTSSGEPPLQEPALPWKAKISRGVGVALGNTNTKLLEGCRTSSSSQLIGNRSERLKIFISTLFAMPSSNTVCDSSFSSEATDWKRPLSLWWLWYLVYVFKLNVKSFCQLQKHSMHMGTRTLNHKIYRDNILSLRKMEHCYIFNNNKIKLFLFF